MARAGFREYLGRERAGLGLNIGADPLLSNADTELLNRVIVEAVQPARQIMNRVYDDRGLAGHLLAKVERAERLSKQEQRQLETLKKKYGRQG